MGTKKATKPQASESTQPAQEAAVSTVTRPVVKFIDVKQGGRMSGYEFLHWLTNAHGDDIERAEGDKLMKFVDNMSEASLDSHQQRFSARRILPGNIDDVIEPVAGTPGLIDVVMLADNPIRPSRYQIMRFFTLRTKFIEQGHNVLKEVVDSILQPQMRGLDAMGMPANKCLTLGELGNLLMEDDPAMRDQAEQAIEQIKMTFRLMNPQTPEASLRRLTIELERTTSVGLTETHRLTEGVVTGSVYSHMTDSLGVQFTFKIMTDLVSDPKSGKAKEVVNEFWCPKLQELSAGAARTASKEKLRMSDASEFMAKPATTSPDVLGGLFKASQPRDGKRGFASQLPTPTDGMSWVQFIGWLTCAIQPVIAGRLNPDAEALQKTILDNLYYRIGRAPDGHDHGDLVSYGKTYVETNAYYVDTTLEGAHPGQMILRVKDAEGSIVTGLPVTLNDRRDRVQIAGIPEGADLVSPKVSKPIISANKSAGTIFTTDAFAFLNHAMGALGSLLTDEEQLKAQVFIRFIDQMYPLKGVSGETFEVEFEEHDRLHVTALEGHDEVARLHLKLK